MVCIYGPGGGETYGLREPYACGRRGSAGEVTYLAVSANILWGYDANIYVTVDGQCWPVDKEQIAAISHNKPVAVVGRTLGIYRVTDLSPAMRIARRRTR